MQPPYGQPPQGPPYGQAPYGQMPYGQPPAPPPQGPPPKKGMSGCMIALIVCAVLAVPAFGIFATLGIYGVRRYLAAAKTVEAKNNIGAIARAGIAAYEQGDEHGKHRLCGSAKPVPQAIPMKTKTATTDSDWGGSADAGWKCLRFSMSQPMYYQYSYVTGAGTGKTGVSASGFEASARGDLDGNGVTSLFAQGVDIKDGVPRMTPQIYIENEFE